MSEQIMGQIQPGSSDKLATIPKTRNHMTNCCVFSKSRVHQDTDCHPWFQGSFLAFLCKTWYQLLLVFQRLYP